ncbi:PDR/VanB family oxidoreductase [Segnochrobactrum spirostomi]|uniref:Oxidoreductase n=1 Tax=Segnochrobactrum spirostomi TaxID=2608987 RepID=A0A6A7XXS3_9HYPH|nr:PDR/VanB family oxidoreductase [Segnochrobactrum spirostomi]MQT11490.1 oxidoreductase [Segnochrobactrum spirostomi]
MSGGAELRVKIAEIEPVATDVRRFRFVAADGGALPLFSGGAHVVVGMEAGDRRIRNAYSLMGSPFDESSYQVSVLKTRDSRGGSVFLHERVAVGDTLVISHPVNLFPVDRRARKHLFIAGGIGITPFLAMAEQLSEEGARFELHYAMRARDCGAYAEEAARLYGGRVHLYCSAEGRRLPVDALLANQPLGTHLYVCGPERMIEGVIGAARDAGWPEENLHAERFQAPPAGEPFRARLARSGISIDVGPHQSLLEALEAAGIDAPYLCRGGACGQCETAIVSCDGTLVHNDHYLTPEERAGAAKIMTCVSRLAGRELVLDL